MVVEGTSTGLGPIQIEADLLSVGDVDDRFPVG
jgi:hypothetical protein